MSPKESSGGQPGSTWIFLTFILPIIGLSSIVRGIHDLSHGGGWWTYVTGTFFLVVGAGIWGVRLGVVWNRLMRRRKVSR
ncbi:hypothetical protein [Streptosporangium sp. NPDC000239]|uniref:Uncharacterized protein n=1 Tax=Streptosporangium jomthongense TaxID=1193683 RepID=A0ABV8EWM7_9ACTN